MRVLIVGSRSISNFDLSAYVPESTRLIISGGAAGVDTLAERFADDKGISKLILRPDYVRFGRAAPLKRNEQMVDIADAVLVIWDGISRGSAHTIRYAERQKKQLQIIRIEQ